MPVDGTPAAPSKRQALVLYVTTVRGAVAQSTRGTERGESVES